MASTAGNDRKDKDRCCSKLDISASYSSGESRWWSPTNGPPLCTCKHIHACMSTGTYACTYTCQEMTTRNVGLGDLLGVGDIKDRPTCRVDDAVSPAIPIRNEAGVHFQCTLHMAHWVPLAWHLTRALQISTQKDLLLSYQGPWCQSQFLPGHPTNISALKWLLARSHPPFLVGLTTGQLENGLCIIWERNKCQRKGMDESRRSGVCSPILF